MPMNVLAARFLLTIGHLVAACLTVQELPLTDAKGAVALMYLSFVFAFGGLVAGIDVFSSSKNGVHIACHFLGGIMLARAMLSSLPSTYLWHVVLVAHVPTACCTLEAASRLLRTASSSSHERY